MAAPQFLPIPENLHVLACETINRRVGRIPFEKDGIEVTGELVAIAMECINAEVVRTLPVKPAARQSGATPGLIGCLNERIGGDNSAVAPVVANVLVDAGLAETAEVLDSETHQQIRGVRLISPWTWHIASPGPKVFAGTAPGSGNNSSDAWMAKCPVCKTGILSRVTGKRLYGIPPTDFYVDCSHCGAKFIPEKNRFRLVSIAHISDPRWRQYLNSSREPEVWMQVAQEIVMQRPEHRTVRRRAVAPKTISTVIMPQTIPLVHRHEHRPTRPVEGIPAAFPEIRDKSLAVAGPAKTHYFRPVPVRFLGAAKYDIFEHSERIVGDMPDSPEFAELRETLETKYPRYLTLRRGPVAAELRLKNDPLYKKFLNGYGEEGFCMFCMDDDSRAAKKGVILVYAQKKICLILACHTSFADIIDKRFGHIFPDMCYCEGDQTACRINTVQGSSRSAPVIYAHELSDDAVIDEVTAGLNAKYGSAGAVPQ